VAVHHWLQLALTDGLGPILIGRLLEASGSAEAACETSVSTLRSIEALRGADKIHASLRAAKDLVPQELDSCASLGVRVICRDDEEFPTLLRDISDPPAVLYVKGALEPRDLNALAIVGSRRCSYYGREQSERFAALLAGCGFSVVSGGARGVDSAAHRGAMSHPQGRTIAVLGSGLDVPYPPENKPLFEQIADRGAVLSEYPLGTPPAKENFPRRNRIVSGMSRGVLVVEADEKSGALITARQACEDHSRPVFAIPGRIDNAMSAGPHKLIREGAVLTTKLEDILENLGPLPHGAGEPMLFEPEEEIKLQPPVAELSLTDRQRVILDHLDGDALHVDQLMERTNLDAPAVLQELTLLSLKGAVKRIDGQSYARVKR
jgi:DNA processing protein